MEFRDYSSKLSSADAAASANVCSMDAIGFAGLSIQITGTWEGTVIFECSGNGVNFKSLNATPTDSSTAVTGATANGVWGASCAGMRRVQVRMSAFTSGEATVTLVAVGAGASGSGGGSGGGGDASAANQSLEIAAINKLNAQLVDADTGAGTATTPLIGIAIPASGGPVAGGTTTNPINVALPAATVTTLTPPAAITGFATAAKQPALGTAGSPSTDVISIQGIASMTKILVTPDANSAVNVAQVNGVTPLMGAGNTGTGSPRVTIATDQVAIPVTVSAGTALIGSVKEAGYQNAMWYTSHLPSANAQATITQAAAGGSVKNVCTGFTVTLAATATAPTAVQLSVALIDGASGGTAYLWRSVISLPAVAGATSAFVKTGAWFVGTANTAMTLEFSAAGGANTIESVTMSGTTTL